MTQEMRKNLTPQQYIRQLFTETKDGKLEITDNKPVCTMCGHELNDWDKNGDFYFKRYIGFGSVYDLNILEARLCCKCFDKILDTILPMFKNNPLSEYEIVSKDGKLIAQEKQQSLAEGGL